jgi:TolB-like protein
MPVTAAVAVTAGRRRVPLIAGLVALAIVAVVFFSRKHGPKVDPRAASLAVAPFGHASVDTALDRLGRDLVVTLSANLDGVGDIRTVDALTVLAQAPKGSQALTLDDARSLALRYGAASVVYGTLVRNGPSVRLDFGLYTSDSGRVLARATVSGSPDSVQVLTDSATWALLHEVWRAGQVPAPSLDAVTTKSVPALRAFLQGEDLIVEGRFTEAEEAFGRAIAADSTFWWAYRRYAYARGWNLKPVDSATVATYRTHRAELPDRERLLIEAWMGAGDTSWTAYFANLRRITEQYPDYWPGWFQLGDQLVHAGPLLGGTDEDAIAALQRTLALNPRLTPAWEHLQWVAGERDPSLAAAALDSAIRLGYGTAQRAEQGFDHTRLMMEYYRTGRLNRRLFDSVADEIVAARTDPIAAFHPYWFSQVDPIAQNDLNHRMLGSRPSPDVARIVQVGVAENWADAGAWDSTIAALRSLGDMDPGGERALDAYRLAVVGAWLGAVDTVVARGFRAPATAAENRLNRQQQAELFWLDGLLAFARSDRRGVASARAALGGGDTAAVALLRRSLAGFETALTNPGEGGRALAQLEWDRTELKDAGYDVFPYLVAVDRLAAARWLLAAGDTNQAARLQLWSDALFADVSYARGLVVGAGPSFFERARIAEARGQKELAAQHYRSFLRRFVLPDARLKHLRDEAEAALARLEGQPTGVRERTTP